MPLPVDSRFAVLASFIFSGDHTLMVLEAVLKRVIGYAIAYFNLSAAASQTVSSLELSELCPWRSLLSRWLNPLDVWTW